MFNDKLIQFMCGDIRESIDAIDDERIRHNRIQESALSSLSSDVETFVSLAEAGECSPAIRAGVLAEARMLERKFRMLCQEFRYMRSCAVNEGRRYGFENWFEDTAEAKAPEVIERKAPVKNDDADPVRINRISIGREKSNAGVKVRNGHVVADMHFSRNELIEECPVRFIKDNTALHSADVREFAIEVDAARQLYGIPYGYATFYLDSITSGLEPNARYELVPRSTNGFDAAVMIYALRSIKTGEPIVILSDDDDFRDVSYERKLGREGDTNTFVETKNFKW